MKMQTELTQKRIFKFWSPLALTWLMMSVEGPLIAAIIARMPEAIYNLGAYGIAFSIGLIIEAPIIMIMSASTALTTDIISFRKLRAVTYALNILLTLGMFFVLVPVVFDLITISLLNLPIELRDLTYSATMLLLPWPAAIGYRRFYQGILIRYERTRLVTYGTVIRLGTMVTTAIAGYSIGSLSGAEVGTLALSVGVIFEAIASRIMANPVIKQLKAENEAEKTLSYRDIINFYFPLALTSVISLAVHPMVTFFVSGGKNAIESLAVLPVINSFIFIFRSLGLSFQEAAIALLKKDLSGFRPLLKFFMRLGLFLIFSLILITNTPLMEYWFIYVADLPRELLTFAWLPTRILAIIPFLSLLISFQRAILVNGRRSSPISYASVVEVSVIAIVMWLTIYQWNFIGATGAAIAIIIGRIFSNAYLMKECKPFILTGINKRNHA